MIGEIREAAGLDMSLYLEMPPSFQCYESKRQDSQVTIGIHDMIGLRGYTPNRSRYMWMV